MTKKSSISVECSFEKDNQKVISYSFVNMKNIKLVNLISELEDYIPIYEHLNTSVSNASVGWHIAHSLLTINGIIEVLKNSDPTSYRWKFKLAKFHVFTFNKIPRGRGKAPSVVQPKTYDKETIEKLLQICKERLILLDSILATKYFNHPYFGHLKKEEAIKFLYLHTQHHLLIIKDIIQ